jgi:hypothetical protein
MAQLFVVPPVAISIHAASSRSTSRAGCKCRVRTPARSESYLSSCTCGRIAAARHHGFGKMTVLVPKGCCLQFPNCRKPLDLLSGHKFSLRLRVNGEVRTHGPEFWVPGLGSPTRATWGGTWVSLRSASNAPNRTDPMGAG